MTPTPKIEDNNTELTPSITDLVYKMVGGLPKPSSIEPTIVIDPTQKSKKEVKIPSVKLFELILSFSFKFFVKFFITKSKLK